MNEFLFLLVYSFDTFSWPVYVRKEKIYGAELPLEKNYYLKEIHMF